MSSPPPGESEPESGLRRQRVLADLGQQALETDDVDRLLADASVAVGETLAVDYCAVLESTTDVDEAALRHGVGWPAEERGSTVPVDDTPAVGAALESDGPVVVTDLHGDPRTAESALLAGRDVSSGAGVTVDSGDDARAVLVVYATEHREFTEADTEFLRSVAALLGSALASEERDRERRRRARCFDATFADPTVPTLLVDPDGTVLEANDAAAVHVHGDGSVDGVGTAKGDGNAGGDAAADRDDDVTLGGEATDVRSITGDSFPEIAWWDDVDAAAVRAEIERAAGGEYVAFAADRTGPDGETTHRKVIVRPVTDDAGDVVAVLVADHDVTGYADRARELEEAQQRYRTLVEHFPNGAVALLDEDLTYQTVGGRPLDAADATPAEIEGRHVADVVPPDLADELAPRYEAAFEGTESDFEIESGGRVYRIRVVPIRDTDGDVFATLGMSQDVTDHVQTKRKLAESEHRYRTLVEHFPNGAVGLFDEDLEYTAVGGQLLDEVGVSPEDRLGNTFADLYPEGLVEEVQPHIRAAVEGQEHAFDVEYRGRYLHATTLPVENAAGEPEAGMLVVQDHTERREYERQLEASNERLEQFAYAASHDLQEPLRMVTSYLELLERRYADELDEDAEEFIEFAVDGAERMRQMIDGLLQYSRVETRGDPFEPVDLDDVFGAVRDDLQLRIEESDAEITADPLPTVRGDPSQLRQVFQNLLDNAIEYSGDEPPVVHVDAERDGDRWRISVSDEGIGIEPDQQDRVFEVFQSLEEEGGQGGTGIGLALCRRVVERHGGEIGVDAEPGEGATFSFTLPAATATDE